MIALVQRETDNITQIITLIKQALMLVDCKNANWALDNFD
jgi:hypothetical protein